MFFSLVASRASRAYVYAATVVARARSDFICAHPERLKDRWCVSATGRVYRRRLASARGFFAHLPHTATRPEHLPRPHCTVRHLADTVFGVSSAFGIYAVATPWPLARPVRFAVALVPFASTGLSVCAWIRRYGFKRYGAVEWLPPREH